MLAAFVAVAFVLTFMTASSFAEDADNALPQHVELEDSATETSPSEAEEEPADPENLDIEPFFNYMDSDDGKYLYDKLDDFDEGEIAEIDVALPDNIPFNMIVSNSKNITGLVYSDEFEIVNKGSNKVTVEIYAAHIHIEHEGYSISEARELPEKGSNIHIEMLCVDGEESSSIVLTGVPSDVIFIYTIDPGETVTFSFSGTVNEIDGPAWGDATVTILLGFRMSGVEPINPDSTSGMNDPDKQEIALKDEPESDYTEEGTEEDIPPEKALESLD